MQFGTRARRNIGNAPRPGAMGRYRIARDLGACPPHNRSSLRFAAAPDSAARPIPAPISACSGSSPSGEASPTTAVTVTFDRPVAGSLDRTVDPGAMFAIAPAIAGAVDWRDPVTLRFRPAAPLTPNTSYTVTVANSFAAMDGSRLREPFAFTFRVRGPRVLAGSPIGPNGGTRLPGARRPVRPGRRRAGRSHRGRGGCLPRVQPAVQPARRVRLGGRRAARHHGRTIGGISARPAAGIATARPTRSAGSSGWPPGRRCLAAAPAIWSCPQPSTSAAGPNRSAGASRPTGTSDWHGRDVAGSGIVFCPTGPLVLRFSTPVRGADVQRHVALRPAAQFALGDTADVRADWVLDATLRPHTAYAVVADAALRDGFGQALTGNPVATITTTGYAPAINYAPGRAVVERNGAAHLRPHLRQRRHPRGGDRAGSRLARGGLPRAERVELERALARAPAHGAARRGSR